MKRLSPIVLSFVAALLVPATLLAAGASGFPTWSSTFTKGRFTVLPAFNKEAVFDKETGLVWEQAPSTQNFNWFNALEVCYNLNLGNRYGWRMPTVEELTSLLDATQPAPMLPAGHPFNTNNVRSAFYWSATTNAFDPTRAWDVSFFNGHITTGIKTFDDFGGGGVSGPFVWCVRGAQGIDGVQ
jgi:uncharacterized protein DUF1566